MTPARRLGREARCACAGLGLAFAAACGAPDVGQRAEVLHAEVHEALGRPGAPSAYVAGARFLPRLRERRLEVGDERIGVLEFLSLQGCRLGELAGFRNSPLGRVMVGTRRLAYEIEVVAVAGPCLESLDDEASRSRLTELLRRKQLELPLHRWNALWTDSELEAYLASEESPGADDWNAFGASALGDVAHHLAGLADVDDVRAVEAALAELRRSAPGGGLLRMLDRVGHHLDAVASLLEEDPPEACTADARRLGRLFQSRHQALHPELVWLDRGGQDVIEALGRIYHASRAGVEVPPAMAQYARERLDLASEQALWPRYHSAVRRHALAWKPTLRACGLLPGA